MSNHLNSQRWTTSKKRPTTAEKRALAREKALEQCEQGYHHTTATFRPGETVCLTCGVVFYCPTCLEERHLLPPLTHAYALPCATHQKARVQA